MSARSGSASSRRPLSASKTGSSGIAAAAVVPVVKPPPPFDHEKVTLAVLLKDSPRWIIFGLRSKANDMKNIPEPVVDPKAKKPAAAAEVVAPTPPAYLFDLYVICEWGLTSPICAHVTDKRHELLAFGQEDGEVSLWNLSERALVNILGKHKSAVSCLHLTAEDDFSQYYLVSGSVDGTICFYSTVLSADCSGMSKLNTTLSSTLVAGKSSARKRHIGSMMLKDYRNDMSSHPAGETNAVVQLQSNSSKVSTIPLLFAQYSHGAILIYDFKSLTLVGRLDNTERQGFVITTMFPVTHSSLPEIKAPVKVTPIAEGEAAVPAVAPTSPRAAVSVTPAATTLTVPKILLTSAVSTVSNTHFHCVFTRNEVPTLFSYALSKVLKQAPQSVSAAELLARDRMGSANYAADDMSRRNSRNKIFGGRGGGVPPTHGASSSHLKLTEERLHALELSFTTLNGLGGSLAPAKPAEPVVEVQKREFNPRKVIQKDVLRSKVEREGRKARMSSTINDLSSFL